MSINKEASQDVLEAIRAYLATDSAPYAIAISGEWGVGKTHLIQSAVGNVFDASSFLHVSLYGLSTVAEIEAAILAGASKIGEDDGGILSGFLNANADFGDGVKVGGLGYAVQFGLRKWKQRELGRAKKLTLCFDDIERWHGDIGICLGYINGLAEHEGAKCIIVGDLNKVPDKQTEELGRARTKIIRYVYTLSHSPAQLINISLNHASIKEHSSRELVERLIHDNIPRLVQFLEQIDCQNIRLLSDVIQLFGEVVSHHLAAFEVAPTKSLTFFEMVLAAAKLFQIKAAEDQYLTALKQYDDQDSHSFLSEMGFFVDHGEEDEIPSVEKRLLESVFFSSDDIRVSSIFGLVSCGFYRSPDFVNSFSQWEVPQPLEYYIDTFKFWDLPDTEGERLFSQVLADIFDEKSIKHPGRLLLFADRVTSDIKRGVVNLDFENTKKCLVDLIDELYNQGTMEYVTNVGERLFNERYIYCLDLLKYVNEKNSQYLADRDRSTTESVWSRITESPEDYLEILAREENRPIFAMYAEPRDVLDSLELLTNGQLFELTRWMGSRITSQMAKPAVHEEHERALQVADFLDGEYGATFSIRAGHMKQISRVIRNKKTTYDPEYLEQMQNEAKQQVENRG